MVLLPQAAGAHQGRRVLSWAAIASRSSAATGALLAGVLVHAGGLRLALLLDAASYLVVVLAVRVGPPAGRRPASPPPPREPGAGRPALAGLHLVATDPVLRVVLAVLLTTISFVGISYVAVFFLAQDVLQAGPRGATLVVGAYGAGMTVGCYVAGRLPLRYLAVGAVRAPVVVGLSFLAPVVVPSLAAATHRLRRRRSVHGRRPDRACAAWSSSGSPPPCWVACGRPRWRSASAASCSR